MLTRGGKQHRSLLILVIFFSSIRLFAAGQQDDPLAKAKQLIEEKQYNEAIVILSEVMRTEPRKFDEAQKLIDEIKKARTTYNDKYKELIDLYNQDQVDLDRAYQIFQELENLDKSPNKATVDAFEKARETAVFLYNNKLFKGIMEDAGKLLQEGKYWEAADKYVTGFNLHQDDFDKKNYGELVKSAMESARKGIEQAVKDFSETKDPVTSFSQDEPGLVDSGRLETVRAEFENFGSAVRTIAAARKRAFDNARTIKQENDQISLAQGKEDFHLTYIYLLTFGRNDVKEKEGILGAIDLLYQDYLDRISGDFLSAMETKLSSARKFTTDGNIEGASADFSQAYQYALLAVQTFTFWESRFYIQRNYALSEEARSIIGEKLDNFLYGQVQAKGAQTYLAVLDDVSTLHDSDRQMSSVSTEEALSSLEERIRTASNSIRGVLDSWKKEQERVQTVSDQFEQSKKALDAEQVVYDDLQGYIQQGTVLERKAVVRIAEIRLAPLLAKLEEQKKSVEKGNTYLQGYEKKIGEGADAASLEVKDPKAGRDIFQAAQGDLKTLHSNAEDVVSSLQNTPGYISASAAVTGEIDSGKKLLSDIEELQNRVSDLEAKAQEQVVLAERYKQEANFRLDQSREALRQRNFEEARSQLQMAGDKFDQSLAVQDDPDLRSRRDAILSSLGEEINTTQNNLIVTEVRRLIDEAKNYYSQERYDLAERTLLRAQSRWKVTHVENKSEIDYWLQIVRVALYVRSGREISETDPLYAEMSQLLNLARENFLKGKSLAEAGKNKEALPYFQEAEKNILYVKIPFPLNQEASVLSLRILKYKDPGNFDNLFRQKYNEAVNKIASNPQEAYIELKDLEAINPGYPGLKKAIYDTEIKLGMRVPPPDPAKQRESDDLYNKAYAIVRGGVRSQFPIAQEYLNKAIKLTPNSQKVASLLDRVEAEIGGRTTTVLSNAAQQQYRLAEEKYINGNYYEALRIVNQLMKDKTNSQYPPLLELKRRIESKI